MDETRLAPTAAAPSSSSSASPSNGSTSSGWLSSSGAINHGRFQPGNILGARYRSVGHLGRGGMGEVFRADDLKLGQPVALKFVPPGVDQDPARLARRAGNYLRGRRSSRRARGGLRRPNGGECQAG